MKWMCIILLGTMATCGHPKKKVHHRAKHGAHAAKRSAPTLVDANWISHYQELEKEFHYTVPDDNKIKSVGNKFDVPMSVRNHYEDMLRAKGGSNAHR